MKNTGIFALTALTTLAAFPVFAGTPKRPESPVVVTHAAVPNGSTWSRAPFPAARPQNDVTPPNGEAFDQDIPPNTPATTPAPEAPPPAVVAIFQPAVDPGTLPTGRATVSASTSLDAARVDPVVRSAMFENRSSVIDDIEARVDRTERAIRDLNRSESQMSASGRDQFIALRDEVKSRQKAVEQSIRSAERATAAEWENARLQLASDYAAYADAVARLDAAAGVAPLR